MGGENTIATFVGGEKLSTEHTAYNLGITETNIVQLLNACYRFSYRGVFLLTIILLE